MAVSSHLSRAYDLARLHHTTHPNPRVGAVVVSADGRVIGEGSHVLPGGPHAEIIALNRAGDATGATVYVSLEPCSHQGRTPPCVDRLISEGVARVVVGTLDPDEKVSGSGVRKLSEAGIEVEVVADPAARAVDPGYFHHRETGMPLVTLKWAMTLDGSVAARDGSSRWITSDAARSEAHRMRAVVDAVVIGAGTVRADDPLLDVRIPGYEGPQPRPVIIAGEGDLPSGARIWDRDPIVVSSFERSLPSGELIVTNGSARPEPAKACRLLADRGLLHLLLEGGPTVAGAWWRAGVIGNGLVHIGARVGGGEGLSPMAGIFATISDAEDVEVETVRNVGGDVVVTFGKKD